MESTSATSSLVTSSERLTGRVKWFNNQAGFGFITVTDGSRAGSDIFVHHSGVSVDSEQYKYLVQGEYVQFGLNPVSSGNHEFQACDVSGINGGKLMCETRREFKQARTSYKTSSGDDNSESDMQVRAPRSVRPPQELRRTATAAPTSAPARRGRGPAKTGPGAGAAGGAKEWTLVDKSSKPKVGRKPRVQKDSD